MPTTIVFFAATVLCVAPLGHSTSQLMESPPSHVVTSEPAQAPIPTPTQPIDPSADPILEDEKLRLEIEKLRADMGPAAATRNWLPIGTIVVGLTAAILGVWQFQSSRRREVNVRLQDQFRDDVNSMVEYLESERSSSARVAASLINLSGIVPLMQDPANHEDKVTDFLLTAVKRDLDFDDSRKVRFESFATAGWPAYVEWLDSHPDDRNFVLYRYEQAIRALGMKYPDYVRTIAVAPETRQFRVSDRIPEKDFLHFTALVAGYVQHVSRLQEVDQRAAQSRFSAITHNPTLSADLLTDQSSSSVKPIGLHP
ncbi:hypothetical protein ACX80Z_15410 [Arthrobacter sp. TMT4-20]